MKKLPTEQVRKPKEKNFSELCNPTPKQREAFDALKHYKYILYGGAMGGGKSYWLRWALIYLVYYYWKKYGRRGVRVGLFCEDYPSLWDRHLSKVMYEFPTWLGSINKANHEFILDESFGEGVLCFRNLDDPSKYKSSEFAAIGIDEITQNDKIIFDFLRTRLRWPSIPDTKFLAGTNPGGKGHSWVKKLWLDKEFEKEEKEAHLFHFIKATAYDNRQNLSETYFDGLSGLPEKMRKAFLEGDWDTFEGQYFTEWSRDRHTCIPFQIPDSWKKFRSYDHGRTKPAACLWFAVDYDGRVWVYKEFYKAGLDVDEIADEIKKMSVGESYHYNVADSAIFAKTGQETIASMFERRGISFLGASKRRVDGWNLVHQYLSYSENTPPQIMFFNNCVNTIKTLPSLVHDNIRPEDVDSEGEDHCADCIRYFLMSLRERKTSAPITDTEKKLKALYKKPGLDFQKYIPK